MQRYMQRYMPPITSMDPLLLSIKAPPPPSFTSNRLFLFLYLFLHSSRVFRLFQLVSTSSLSSRPHLHHNLSPCLALTYITNALLHSSKLTHCTTLPYIHRYSRIISQTCKTNVCIYKLSDAHAYTWHRFHIAKTWEAINQSRSEINTRSNNHQVVWRLLSTRRWLPSVWQHRPVPGTWTSNRSSFTYT